MHQFLFLISCSGNTDTDLWRDGCFAASLARKVIKLCDVLRLFLCSACIAQMQLKNDKL